MKSYATKIKEINSRPKRTAKQVIIISIIKYLIENILYPSPIRVKPLELSNISDEQQQPQLNFREQFTEESFLNQMQKKPTCQ